MTLPTNSYPAITSSVFEKYGHQGRFNKSFEVNKSGSAAEYWFTASVSPFSYGAGGIITTAGSVGTASLSNGGVIKLEDLAVGQIHELSLSYVKEDAANSVYVLIRNHRIV